jgi:predicted transcriptional regulator
MLEFRHQRFCFVEVVMQEKSERFGMVLSPDDKDKLRQLADDRGESRAVVVRDLIREAAESDSEADQAFSTG